MQEQSKYCYKKKMTDGNYDAFLLTNQGIGF